jgi:hypothetical protein
VARVRHLPQPTKDARGKFSGNTGAHWYIVYRRDGVLRYAAPTANARDWFLALVANPQRFVVLHGWRALRRWRSAHAWGQYRSGGMSHVHVGGPQ